MTVKLTSYINFNGDAAQALEFYESVFGGTVEGDTFGAFNEKSGGAMPVDPQDNDKIMHAILTAEHVELMISDYPSYWENVPAGSNITLSLSGDDDATLRKYWDALSQGGTIEQPLEVAPWGDAFGSIKDKYGVSWMVNISPVQAQ